MIIHMSLMQQLELLDNYAMPAPSYHAQYISIADVFTAVADLSTSKRAWS